MDTAAYHRSLSIWEKESFFSPVDHCIIGSGFVGLWTAYWLKKRHPKRSVLILERGLIPTGASTRNAGFACFGSLTELLHDARTMGLDKTLEVVEMRYKGIRQILNIFKSRQIEFELSGGYDLLTVSEIERYPDIDDQIDWMNSLLSNITDKKKVFRSNKKKINKLGLKYFDFLIENKLEGGLHSGKLSQQLLSLVQGLGVTILNCVSVKEYSKNGRGWLINANNSFQFNALNLIICTNAFSKELMPDLEISPARGQVLLTSPIDDLRLRGTFHFDEGFYYFRNLDNRVLLGGARNKALSDEATTELTVTETTQQELERFLRHHILPDKDFTITDRWSGIMAMGPEKYPIIRQVEPGLIVAVRMSGMGVALAPVVGEKVAGMV